MFGQTIAKKVKKVMAERLKEAEREYKECQAGHEQECKLQVETAIREKEIKNIEVSENLVKKVLGG